MFGEPDVIEGYTCRARRPYGTGPEAEAVNREIGDFVFQNSPAFTELQRNFGSHLRVKELRGILTATRMYLQEVKGVYLPKPSRNTIRSFPLMVKYISDHYEYIVPLLKMLVLCDNDKEPIPTFNARADPPRPCIKE
jgi:hypothetical protein